MGVPGLNVTTANVVVAISVVATTTGLVAGWLAFGRRHAAGGLPLAGLSAATVGWILGYTAELLEPSVAQKLVWVDVSWLPAAIAPVCWLLFALEYSGRDRHVDRQFVALLLVVPLLSTALLWTNPSHDLVITGYQVVDYGSIRVLDWEYGPVFWVTVGYAYVLVLAGAFLVGETAVESLEVYRFQSFALISAAVIPIAASVLTVGFDVTPIDATSFAFAASDALCVVALTRLDLLDARPVPGHLARGRLMESLTDAIVVTDARGYVTDANPTARTVLGAPQTDLVGTHLDDLPALPTSREETTAIHDAEIEVDGETRYYDVQFTELTDSRGRRAGRIVSLRDVTERRIRVQQLSVLNRVLRHDLRTRSNLVLGYADMASIALEEGAPAEAVDRLDKVRENATSLVDASNKVRYAESLLSTDARKETRTIREVVNRAVTEVHEDQTDTVFRVSHEDAALTVPAVAGIVVHNLVENAAEHNDAPEPTVDITTTTARDGRHLHVTITDDGPGIPRHELEVLEDAETPLRHGSGVGLWLVQWGIDMIGGTIDFDVPPDPANPDGDETTDAASSAGTAEAGDATADVDRSADADGAPADGAPADGTRDEPAAGAADERARGTRVRLVLPIVDAAVDER